MKRHIVISRLKISTDATKKFLGAYPQIVFTSILFQGPSGGQGIPGEAGDPGQMVGVFLFLF